MVKVVTLYGCRHGIGCSNLAANLATTLVQQQKRVGLIDSDLQTPALHLLFGLKESAITNNQNICFWGPIKTADINPFKAWVYPLHLKALPKQGAGVCLLSHSRSLVKAAQHLGEFYNVNPVPRGLRSVASELALDYLFIDIPTNLDEETLTCFTITDTLLLLIGLEAYDFQEVAVIIDIAKSLGILQIILVPSCISPGISSTGVVHRLETLFNTEVPSILPFSEEMAALASRGVFALHYPEHKLTQAVQTLATHIETPLPLPLDTTNDGSLRKLLTGPSNTSHDQGSLFRILELPTEQRQVAAYILRYGNTNLLELEKALGLSSSTIKSALEDLVARDWLSLTTQAGKLHYQLQNPPHYGVTIEDSD